MEKRVKNVMSRIRATMRKAVEKATRRDDGTGIEQIMAHADWLPSSSLCALSRDGGEFAN